MGLTLTRLWSVWVARARRRRLRSRSSSERSVARSLSDTSSERGSRAEESTFIDASDSLWLQTTRDMPILDGGCPVASLPQDLLLRYPYA